LTGLFFLFKMAGAVRKCVCTPRWLSVGLAVALLLSPAPSYALRQQAGLESTTQPQLVQALLNPITSPVAQPLSPASAAGLEGDSARGLIAGLPDALNQKLQAAGIRNKTDLRRNYSVEQLADEVPGLTFEEAVAVYDAVRDGPSGTGMRAAPSDPDRYEGSVVSLNFGDLARKIQASYLRALRDNGYFTIEQLVRASRQEVASLKGRNARFALGDQGAHRIQAALWAQGRGFRSPEIQPENLPPYTPSIEELRRTRFGPAEVPQTLTHAVGAYTVTTTFTTTGRPIDGNFETTHAETTISESRTRHQHTYEHPNPDWRRAQVLHAAVVSQLIGAQESGVLDLPQVPQMLISLEPIFLAPLAVAGQSAGLEGAGQAWVSTQILHAYGESSRAAETAVSTQTTSDFLIQVRYPQLQYSQPPFGRQAIKLDWAPDWFLVHVGEGSQLEVRTRPEGFSLPPDSHWGAQPGTVISRISDRPQLSSSGNALIAGEITLSPTAEGRLRAEWDPAKDSFHTLQAWPVFYFNQQQALDSPINWNSMTVEEYVTWLFDHAMARARLRSADWLVIQVGGKEYPYRVNRALTARLVSASTGAEVTRSINILVDLEEQGIAPDAPARGHLWPGFAASRQWRGGIAYAVPIDLIGSTTASQPSAGGLEGAGQARERLRGLELPSARVTQSGVGLVASGLEDAWPLSFGAALNNRAPVAFVVRDERQAAGLAALGVTAPNIFQVSDYADPAAAFSAADDYLGRGLGVRPVRLSRTPSDGAAAYFAALFGVELNQQAATGLEAAVGAAQHFLSQL